MGFVCIWSASHYMNLLIPKTEKSYRKEDSIETVSDEFNNTSSLFITLFAIPFIIYLQKNQDPGYVYEEGQASYQWALWIFFSSSLISLVGFIGAFFTRDGIEFCFFMFLFVTTLGFGIQVIINCVLAIKLRATYEPVYFSYIVASTCYSVFYFLYVAFNF